MSCKSCYHSEEKKKKELEEARLQEQAILSNEKTKIREETTRYVFRLFYSQYHSPRVNE